MHMVETLDAGQQIEWPKSSPSVAYFAPMASDWRLASRAAIADAVFGNIQNGMATTTATL